MKQFNNRKSHRGFTLIELLIVIAILGILAVAVVTALNIVGNLNKGTLARAKTFNASIENALSINQVGKWSFEEQNGDTAKDTSGYGNNGDLGGTSNACPGAAACPTWKTAIDCGLGYGGCLKFDGSNDYISMPSILIRNTDLTITAWVFRSGSTQGSIFYVDDGTPGFAFRVMAAGAINAGIRDGVGNFMEAETTTSISLNQWNHIALVVNKGAKSISIFINGVKSATVTNTNINFSQIPDYIVALGAKTVFNVPTSPYFNGIMDEVAIYKQALGAYQIQQLYAQGLVRHVLAIR